MALTPQQKTKIKKILQQYNREVRGIVAKHKKIVTKAVEDLDKQKAEKIKKLIEQT
jgi:Spy/CpxP family protein refolding chaperone